MRLGDELRVSNLITELGYFATPHEVRQRFESLDPERHANLVAENSQGWVVAWIHVTVKESMVSPATAEVAALVVNDACRGFGIGRRLVGAAQEWAQQRGLKTLRVSSNVLREDSHGFYQRLGFSVVKTSAQYVRKL